MTDTHSAPNVPTAPTGIRGCRRLRITLLSLAAAIWLLGAAAASLYGYASIAHLR